jgi:diguanylate cyclase (GGDEF)-like protein
LLLADGGRLEPVRGEDKGGRTLEARDARISSLAEQVARDGAPIYSTNLDIDQKLGARQSVNELGLHMVVVVPLKGPTGTVGVIYCDGKSTLDTIFTTANRNALEALADHAGAAIENARLFEGAIRDPLTGLLNLGFFHVKVGELQEHPVRADTATFLAVVEVDDALGFAARLGPQAADHVLKLVAGSLRTHVVLPELVARLGPSTFGLCFAERDERLALERLEKIVAQNASATIAGIEDPVAVRLTIGYSVLSDRYDAAILRAQHAQKTAEAAPRGVAFA